MRKTAPSDDQPKAATSPKKTSDAGDETAPRSLKDEGSVATLESRASDDDQDDQDDASQGDDSATSDDDDDDDDDADDDAEDAPFVLL